MDSLIDLAFPTQDKIDELGNSSYSEQADELLVLKEEFLNRFRPLNIFNISSEQFIGKVIKATYIQKKRLKRKIYILIIVKIAIQI